MPVLRMNARIASAFAGLLASSPNSITARLDPLMILAASSSESRLPGPKLGRDEPLSASQFASASITFFGRLTNAAPGRSDSAARNALATVSAMDSGELASALNFVRGLNADGPGTFDEP